MEKALANKKPSATYAICVTALFMALNILCVACCASNIGLVATDVSLKVIFIIYLKILY